MERFVSNRRRGPTCESNPAEPCRWKRKVPTLLRLNSVGDNECLNDLRNNSTKMDDSKQEKSYCSMKSLKNYFNLGNFLESAFGFGNMSTKRNLTSSEPIPGQLLSDCHNSDNTVHDIYKKSEMCDRGKKEKTDPDNRSGFWQGIGFGCGQKVYSQFSNISRRPCGQLLNGHTNDQMNTFRHFHGKPCVPQDMNKTAPNPRMCQGYYNRRNTDIKRNDYCSSPRTRKHSRGFSPRNNRRRSHENSSNHYSGAVKSSEMCRSFKDRIGSSVVASTDRPPENVNTRTYRPTKVKPCESKDDTEQDSSNKCENVQLDWFTYGDTGYATFEANDSSEAMVDQHQELTEIDTENSFHDVAILKNTNAQLEETKEITENVQECEEFGHRVPESKDDVGELKTINCDKPSNSSARPFHCSNIAKSNGAKDYSYMLFLRSNKKQRPSAKKRRRRKAREQDIQFCSIKGDPSLELNSGQKSCSPPGALAFILGVDFKDRKCTGDQTHSFYVSFSDDDDTDFSDDEDGNEYDNDWSIIGDNSDPHCLFNFTFTCSENAQKPDVKEPSGKVQKYNVSWGIGSCEDSSCPDERVKKVHFPEDKYLVRVHPIIAWAYAYRNARKGPWEQFARDRERFFRRITEIKDVILPVLEPNHRSWIFSQYHVPCEC